jgi:hypothetical protein
MNPCNPDFFFSRNLHYSNNILSQIPEAETLGNQVEKE